MTASLSLLEAVCLLYLGLCDSEEGMLSLAAVAGRKERAEGQR